MLGSFTSVRWGCVGKLLQGLEAENGLRRQFEKIQLAAVQRTQQRGETPVKTALLPSETGTEDS